jgi:hypothetical protein
MKATRVLYDLGQSLWLDNITFRGRKRNQMARRQRFNIFVGTEPTQDRIECSSRLIIWHGIVKRLRRRDATKEPAIQW